MGWPISTAQKELIDSFECYIDANESILRERDILIWGAGVRGITLGIVLEARGYKNFSYIDNDERKWGKNINGYKINSPHYMNKKKIHSYIVIPLESGETVKKQLEEEGLEEGIDFAVIYVSTNDQYITEFFRKYRNETLILSDGFLDKMIINEPNSVSLKDRFWTEFGKENIKILSIACAGMLFFYHMLRLQALLGNIPKELWLFIDFELLTEYHHLLPRAQHYELLQLLQEQGKVEDRDFKKYIQLAKQRSANFKMEYKFSPQRMSDECGGSNVKEIQKAFLRQEWLYNLNICSEEATYLKKILVLCQENEINARVILKPINIEEVQEDYGYEFEKAYCANCYKLQDFVEEFGGKYYDMSTVLPRQCFAETEGLFDGIYANGQQRIISFLREKFFDGQEI